MKRSNSYKRKEKRKKLPGRNKHTPIKKKIKGILTPKQTPDPPTPTSPPSDAGWLVTMLAMVGRLCVTAAFQVLRLYSTELFPTEVRLRGLANGILVFHAATMLCPTISEKIVRIFFTTHVLIVIFICFAFLLVG